MYYDRKIKGNDDYKFSLSNHIDELVVSGKRGIQ